MRLVSGLIVGLSLLVAPAVALADDKPATSDITSLVLKPVDPAFKAAYDADVTKLRAGEVVDIASLRARHAKIFGGYADGSDWKGAVLQAFQAQEWGKGLELARKRLDTDYLDLDAHFMARYAASRANDEKSAKAHDGVIKQSLKAITGGRTGHSADQAWAVMSVREEYLMLQALGLEPRNQSLVHKDGHSYDVMAAWNPAIGTADELWFNIDAFFGKGF